MESANLQEEEYHHHQQQQQQQQQLQDELVVGSSNSSVASPCFSLGANHHAWRPPSFFLNGNNIHANCEEEAATRNSLPSSMIQNMGFALANPSIHDDQQSLISNKIIKQKSSLTSSSSSSDLHRPHNNNSASSSAFPTDMLSPSASPSELLLLNTLSADYKHPVLANREFLRFSALHQGGNKGVTTNFSQIFPSVNISDLGSNNNNNNNSISELVSSSNTTEMVHDLQGNLDVYGTARLLSGGDLISHGVDSSNHLLELFKFEHHRLEQQSNDLKLWNNTNNLSPYNNNGVLESKRPSCIVEPKSTHQQHNQLVSKKPRFESRSSCPPFKVRKEKLGDRIAALQQLVAPFGKTDTASVLMEAIGYIKFLQNQVEV
uniref:BHLH domain-containing protein n=1 Tax=Opuntia streptacantha TaxID=393608 RepID=A0A7C8ZUK1_OPUST